MLGGRSQMSTSTTTATLGRETSLSIFERMLAMRHFEEAVIRLYNDGRFVSHYHVYIGQEATGAGVLETLGDEDAFAQPIEITVTSSAAAAIRAGRWPRSSAARADSTAAAAVRCTSATLRAASSRPRQSLAAARDWLPERPTASK